MEETTLRARKQQLETQLEYINKRLNGKGAKQGPNQGGSDDMLRECALLIALRDWKSQTPFSTMVFVTKANEEEEEKKKEVVPTTVTTHIANTTTTTTTTVPVKVTDAPTTIAPTEPKTTLKMLVNERLLEHYSKIVMEQVCVNALKGGARITIDANHAPEVLAPFQEYCEKEGIRVAHVSRQASSFVVTLAW